MMCRQFRRVTKALKKDIDTPKTNVISKYCTSDKCEQTFETFMNTTTIKFHIIRKFVYETRKYSISHKCKFDCDPRYTTRSRNSLRFRIFSQTSSTSAVNLHSFDIRIPTFDPIVCLYRVLVLNFSGLQKLKDVSVIRQKLGTINRVPRTCVWYSGSSRKGSVKPNEEYLRKMLIIRHNFFRNRTVRNCKLYFLFVSIPFESVLYSFSFNLAKTKEK